MYTAQQLFLEHNKCINIDERTLNLQQYFFYYLVFYILPRGMGSPHFKFKYRVTRGSARDVLLSFANHCFLCRKANRIIEYVLFQSTGFICQLWSG